MGDQIVLALDAYKDVRTGTVTRQFHALGLQETIIAQHGIHDPPTYKRGFVRIGRPFYVTNLASTSNFL
jgi:hypothetical protein